ncbi:MAG: response regulator [Acidobacteria bacterium]|nr:response regulator [Acidobacteriota bacterium]
MPPASAIPHGEPPDTTVRVLVVDDREDNLLTLGAILDGMGLELTLARSGADALRCLLRSDFAVILLDVNMPGIDGLETAAMIRQRPSSARTPIIFLTADPEQVGLRQAYSLGAVDYLLTPVDPGVLRTKVGVFADLFRKTAEIQRQSELLRRAEVALRRDAERALRSADEKLRLMIESARDYAIFSLDLAGRITSWNSGTARMFQLDDAEALGRDHALLLADGEAEATLVGAREHRERAALSGRSERDAWYRRRDGGRFLGNAVLTPMHEDGAIVGFTEIVRDVTQARRMEQERLEVDRRKDEFLAVLAHELRNPLAAISYAVEACRTPALRGRSQDSMEVIARQVSHLARLTDDLLDLSRLTRGKVELHLQPLDLRRVVEQTVASARGFVESRGHAIVQITPGEPLWINGDPVRLEQVLGNLLTNAAKYSPEPGQIQVTAGRDGTEARIEVRDKGLGIAPEMLEQIFDMFAQLDNSLARSTGGLGIGLTLARQLMALHGGRVSAHSDGPGCGSVFTLHLPLLADAPAPEPEAPVTRRAADGPGSRVLVVDDNRDSADLLSEFLALAGYEVAVAYDGLAALEAAHSVRPRVVVLDIGLPRLDGYQVAARLRAELPEIRLVALSGYGQERDRERSRQAGFDEHLLKPVQHEVLLGVLSSLANS